MKCSALQNWDHAALQHCSRVSAESKVTPQADTRHLSLVPAIYGAQTQQTHTGQTLLDWNIICLIDIISPAAGYLLIAKTVQNFLQTCHLLITIQHMLPLRGWVITGIVRSPVQEECDDGV